MNKALPKIEGNRYVVHIFTIICVLLMSLSCSNNPFTVGNMGHDSSVFNYVAHVILSGGMPYRDSFDHKGPLIYLIDMFGQIINKDIGVWIVEVIFIYVIFFFAYKIARLAGCGNNKSIVVVVVSMLALAYFFEGGNLTEEYACAFIMISLYSFFRFFKEGSVRSAEIVLCGVSFAAVSLLRINMIVLWGVMCIGVLIDCIQKKNCEMLIKYLGLFVLGVAVVTIPIIYWLIKHGAFASFIEDYFYFNFRYSKAGGSPRNVLDAAYRFGTGGPVVLIFPIVGYFCLKKKELVDWLCEVAIILSVASMCMSGHAHRHYGMILVPFVSYSFSLLLNEYRDLKKDIPLLIACICMVVMLLQSGVLCLGSGVINSILHITYEETHVSKEIAEVIRNITTKDDRITVCENWDQIYLIADRMSSSVYSYQDPISDINPIIRQEYINDIKQLNAKVIIINKSSAWHKDLDTIIDQNYELIQVVESTEIYRLNSIGN